MASEEMITITRKEYDSMKFEIGYLGHQLAEMKRLIFGSKRERFISNIDPKQGMLFEFPEAEQPEKQTEQITYTRNKPEDKKQPLRMEIPAHLPRIIEEIEPEFVP